MGESQLDPEKGSKVAVQLRKLGVRGILITAAEQGYITELECRLPTCHCPEELGGKGHFDNVPEALPEWMPTVDHIQPKSEQGKLTFENIRLAHRLCNRAYYAQTERRSIEKDLKKVEAARQEAIESSARKIVLKTERLELRPTAPDMFDDIWASVEASAKELADWMDWAVQLDPEGTKEFLQRATEHWASGRDRPFTIFLDSEHCGQCSLDRVDPLQRSAEIGYWMRSDLCGQGLMTEAAAAVVKYSFYTEGLHRISLHAGIENAASIRVAEKLGFQREGLLRHGGYGANGYYDSYVYGLLVTDPGPHAQSPATA